MTVIILPEVIDFLNELIYNLYKRDYFSFKEDARLYVADIYEAIPDVFQGQQHKTSATKLKRRGEFYVTFNSTDRTTWYIFFSNYDKGLVVEYITNNHSSDASFINRG